MTESFYWYDFETTGTDPIVDRPLQFAGIRTDHDLNEIAEPQNIYCLPADDIYPQAEAIAVTGILMSEVRSKGLSECDFAEAVLREFSQPQTCVAGFNSLRFDDEFTRQMLYRNFQDPYAREWRSGNSRWDVIDLFRTAYALRPEGFNWPEREPGVPSFRLEDLARANGLAHLDAHDALADVRATIEVTRLVRQAQPKLYQYLFNLRDKKQVLQQLYPLGKKPIVHVSGMYGAVRGCTSIVLPICQHPTNGNAVICFDLTESPDDLLAVNPAELERLVFTPAADLGEDETRIGLKTIHINRCPSVAPLSTLDERQAERLNIDLALCDGHFQRLQGAPGLVEKIQEVWSRNRFEDRDDPDYQLYQGPFFPDSDRATMIELLAAKPEHLAAYEGRFQDDRLDEMLFRFRARNHPATLSDDERKRWDSYRRTKWQDGRVLSDEREKAARLLQSEHVDERERKALLELDAYLAGLSDGLSV